MLFAMSACREGAAPDATVATVDAETALAAAVDAPPLYPDRFAPAGRSETLRFGRGDTLDGLLRRAEIAPEQRAALCRAVAAVFDLGSFREGREIVLRWDRSGGLLGLDYALDYVSDLCAWRRGDGFAAERFTAALDWEPRVVTASATPSFYESLTSQGEDGDLATRVADLFAGEVDFFFDLRPDDRMEILVETASRPDRAGARTRVLAAWMRVDGERRGAYLFPDEDGVRHYYHADGGSLERQFMRAPLNYTRISSGFSHNRLHPVLGVHRPHLGVDYAAPVGTPVMATADGTVVRRGRGGGEGRFVTLRHPGRIETTYMHLSSFAKGTAVGQRVKKGQVVGRVGSSGLSTGPHLDYRIKVDGRYVDARNFRSRPAAPLEEARKTVFAEQVARYDALWSNLAPPVAETVAVPDFFRQYDSSDTSE